MQKSAKSKFRFLLITYGFWILEEWKNGKEQYRSEIRYLSLEGICGDMKGDMLYQIFCLRNLMARCNTTLAHSG